MEQKPVAYMDSEGVGTLSISYIKELESRMNNDFPYHLWPTELFTADQLKAEREKAIREAASVAYGFHDCDAIAEEILALLTNEKEPE